MLWYATLSEVMNRGMQDMPSDWQLVVVPHTFNGKAGFGLSFREYDVIGGVPRFFCGDEWCL